MYAIKFYATTRGDCPFESFPEGAESKVKAKFVRLMDLLKCEGPNLKRPYADILRDGRGLRVRLGTNRYRALYFFIRGHHIVITHGIIKKSDEVPPGEIDRTVRFKRDFEDRLTRGEVTL